LGIPPNTTFLSMNFEFHPFSDSSGHESRLLFSDYMSERQLALGKVKYLLLIDVEPTR
jgi:hypothetical protein